MTTVGWDALFAVLFILLGRRIWHYGKVHNYMTPTDFFDDIYDSKKLNVLVTVVSILSTMVYLQVQIVGGILVMNVGDRRCHFLLCRRHHFFLDPGYLSGGPAVFARL